MPPTPAASILRCHREPPVWLGGDLTIRRYDPAEFDTVLALHRLGLASVGVRPGDSVYYAGGLRHRWRSLSDTDARLVVVQQNRPPAAHA